MIWGRVCSFLVFAGITLIVFDKVYGQDYATETNPLLENQSQSDYDPMMKKEELEKMLTNDSREVAGGADALQQKRGVITPLEGINQDFAHYHNDYLQLGVDYPKDAEITEFNTKVIFYLQNPTPMIIEVTKYDTPLKLTEFAKSYIKFKEGALKNFTIMQFDKPEDISKQISFMSIEDSEDYSAFVYHVLLRDIHSIYVISSIGIVDLKYDPYLAITDRMLNSFETYQ